jgi:hypothetical protein
VIPEYIEAFNRCYPQKKCEIKPKRVRGQVEFRVIIDGDDGGVTLSNDDLREATRMFNRGYSK